MARTEIRTIYPERDKMLPVSEIEYFKADDKYVLAHDRAGNSFFLDSEAQSSLVHLGKEFVEDFVRVHRSILMRRSALCKVVRQRPTSNYTVETFSGFCVPLARREVSNIRAIIAKQESDKNHKQEGADASSICV